MRALGSRVDRIFSERWRVAPESATLAAVVVSLAAGVALAAGGAAREPRLWLLVPSLGLARRVLSALETRLVDCRRAIPRTKEPLHGKR